MSQSKLEQDFARLIPPPLICVNHPPDRASQVGQLNKPEILLDEQRENLSP
jgi:hypothetical protein